MHLIKYAISILNFLIIIALCGCDLANSDAQSEYVNISEVVQKIEGEQLNINIDSFEYDDKPYNIMKFTYTIDGDYFYKFSYPHKKINLQSGRVQYVCQIPGCAHDEITSPGCISYQYFGSPVATSSGIYYTDENKVMLFNGESSMTVLENDFYTDYEEEAYPGTENSVSDLVIKDKIMYIAGPTFFFTYNLDTQERSEPYAISDSLLMSLCVGDEYLYYSTDSLEFFMYDLEEKSIQKLDDKVGQVCIKDDKVYYVKYKNEIPYLYTMAADGSNNTELIKDCWVNYYITNDYIYYQGFSNTDIFRCEHDGNNPVKINLHSDDTQQELVWIISTGSMNHVFITDNDIVYIIEDGSTEFIEIKIGEE